MTRLRSQPAGLHVVVVRAAVEESELAGLIKEHRIWDIDELANCRGFTIAN